MSTQAHPFEIAGMGLGPYRFGGIIEMPNLSDEGASNFANSDPYREIREAKLKAGAGTCACCGMAITVICVVIDGAGDRWGVGSDCVEKIGEPALCNAAKVAVAKRRNRMARERNEAKRQERQRAFDAAISTDSRALPGETNAAFRERLRSQQAAEKFAQDARAARRGAILKPVADVVRDGRGGFCDSVAADMEHGIMPSGRGLDLTMDIYAKRFGRRNSNAYEAANQEVCRIIEEAQSFA